MKLCAKPTSGKVSRRTGLVIPICRAPVNAEFFTTLRGGRPKTIEKTSLAILPFKVLGGAHTSDTGEDFLGIGLADALISRLSGIPRIVVRPTSSVLPFVNSNPFEAGLKLGVDFVLDGNIRRSGDRIRVSVQLLSVEDNSTKWAQAFDEDLKESGAGDFFWELAASLLPRYHGMKPALERAARTTKDYNA